MDGKRQAMHGVDFYHFWGNGADNTRTMTTAGLGFDQMNNTFNHSATIHSGSMHLNTALGGKELL